MRPSNKMSVKEMDRVNDLIDLSSKIDRLNLSKRERAFAYFRYMKQDANANLDEYAQKFDELVLKTQRLEVLKKIQDCALEIRRESK